MLRDTDVPDAGGGERPTLCYVTDRQGLGAADPVAKLIDLAREAIAAGVDWVQIREKDLPTRDLMVLVAAVLSAANQKREPGRPPGRVSVNDRLDVALAAGAAGVHLGRESIRAAEVVRWCRAGNAPEEFTIGVSCHRLADAREAQAGGADYVFFGPVFDTPSKRPFGPPQGISRLAEVCGALRIPVIAIGGVDEKNAEECLRAGAAGIAAIRLFQESRGAASLGSRIAKLHQRRVDRP